MAERLPWIKVRPQAWCHWDPVRGGLQAHQQVQALYPDALCYAFEPRPGSAKSTQALLSKPWWHLHRWWNTRLQVQAAPQGGVQMLWANMALHQSCDPAGLMQQWQQALAIQGFLMFSCLGPDTVRELRSIYRQMAWGPCGHDLTDMHDWGDMLMQAGFAEPVMDMERIVLTYESPAALLADLRELGRNLHPQRFAGLRAGRWKRQMEAALLAGLARPAENGRLALSFEVIYGHAIKPEPRIAVQPETRMSLADMRQALKKPPNFGAVPGQPPARLG
jgi:malonyl-CoA O-methyltransferase